MYTTDITVFCICTGCDHELPIDGFDTSAACIGILKTVQQDGNTLATVHQARTAKRCEIFV